MTRTIHLVVVGAPDSPELEVLQQLPESVKVLAVGQKEAEIESSLREKGEEWDKIEVLLNCGVGAKAGQRKDIEQFFDKLSNLKWLHSCSAGLEHLLFPALAESQVVLTNAKGVYSHSLAEYALTVFSWFAKDFPRLLRQKSDKVWDKFEVEELRNKTLGVIGLGDIGMACATLAKAFKMNIVGLRRRLEMTQEEKRVVDTIYPPNQIIDMVKLCDYVIAATPYTPATDKIVSASVIQAMKPNVVFVNIGRGKCVDEQALIQALSERRIKGAGLDVFETEPLPLDSPLWDMDNVFLSPHNADLTKDFQFEAMQFFVENVKRYIQEETLLNICNKKQGY